MLAIVHVITSKQLTVSSKTFKKAANQLKTILALINIFGGSKQGMPLGSSTAKCSEITLNNTMLTEFL